MAQAFSTGPCDLWVGVGSSGAPLFLGHSEDGYEIAPRPQWDPVMNDLSGTKVPYDRCWQGADAMLTPGGGLTRWNENVYAAIQAYASAGRAFGGGIRRGSEGPQDRGSLMATEGLAIGVWFRYPYAAIAAFASLPGGYRFVQCVVESDSMRPGAKAYKVAPAFYAWPQINISSGSGLQGWLLWDQDMSALGTIN